MNNPIKFILLLSFLAVSLKVDAQPAQSTMQQVDSADATPQLFSHPWQGKRVAYLGDSITDPKNYGNEIEKFWKFLNEWLGITPFVYGKSGRQWNDIPRQAELLKAEHPEDVDAIIVFIGTNDFNASVPIGDWFEETQEEVMAARSAEKQLEMRKRRQPVMCDSTYRGRINKGILRMKQLFPDKQIVLLTPLHRSTAEFNSRNVQPDESYANRCGEYIDAYINSVKEAGNLWAVPVIDLNSVSGLNPMVEEQLFYFHDPSYDRLHPSTSGQKRMARTLMQQLLTLPVELD